MSFFINKLAIIGVGLIGGSIAKALKSAGLVGEVVGVNRSATNLATALEMGVIDHGTHSVVEAVSGADLIVVATPVSTVVPMVAQFAPALDDGAVVTDVGSVKGEIVAGCDAILTGKSYFVGSHPIAGREYAGVEAALTDLFVDTKTLVTPSATTHGPAVKKVTQLWEALGSKVETMDPAYHDQVLAATSHLPHLIAFNLMRTLSDIEDRIPDRIFRLAAGAGFRDSTRVASSDPAMWRDVCLENRDSIVEILERFHADLGRMTERVKKGDAEGLYGIFSRSKATRDRILVGGAQDGEGESGE